MRSTKAAKRAIRLAEEKMKADSLERAKLEYIETQSTYTGRRLTTYLRYKYIYVAARNGTIEQKAHQRYGKAIDKTILNIFCVGNKDYEGHELSYQEVRAVALKKSGILELRNFCHSVVAKAQFRASNHFLDTEIPNLVQSLRLWIDAAADEDLHRNISSNLVPKLQSVR